MRTITIVGLIVLLAGPAFGEPAGGEKWRASDFAAPPSLGAPPHHQPSEAEVRERENARVAAGAPAEPARQPDLESEPVERRLLAACMGRLHLDEPLGSEQAHSRFCTCRMNAVALAGSPQDLAALAVNLEQRNANKPAADRLPAAVDRSNQAAIQACMNELSR
jgi:hypothetical protein